MNDVSLVQEIQSLQCLFHNIHDAFFVQFFPFSWQQRCYILCHQLYNHKRSLPVIKRLVTLANIVTHQQLQQPDLRSQTFHLLLIKLHFLVLNHFHSEFLIVRNPSHNTHTGEATMAQCDLWHVIGVLDPCLFEDLNAVKRLLELGEVRELILSLLVGHRVYSHF